jgi:3-dehydroquinate synthase
MSETPSTDEPRYTIARVRVELGTRAYDIMVGRGAAELVGELSGDLLEGRRALVISDTHVAALHADRLLAALAFMEPAPICLSLAPGEATKTWSALESVVDAIIAQKLERGDLVIAFGGGVIGDLAGFAAAITRRGMRFIQVPTTLLAQVDSSVGGKTGINTMAGKNLVGAFHQPALVIADTALLDTLSAREMRAGYAEVVKYGLIDRPDFFEWLEAGAWRGIFAGGPEREEAVCFSCAAKAAIVARDETETGDRALLNLGHTFGHALETLTGYESARLVHGEGVAIGIAMAHRFSQTLGLCAQEVPSRVSAHLEAVGLPTRVQHIPGAVGDAEAILAAIRQDKKVSRGALTFILSRGIGQSFIAKGIEPNAVLDFLKDELA